MAAKRVVQQHGARDVVLLFCDTRIEDEDCYRFLRDGAYNVGAPLVMIADGRTPHEVYKDRRFLGNSRVAHCSADLKQRLADDYVTANFDPTNLCLYIGIDWSESHRFYGDGKKRKGFHQRMAEQGWRCEAPLLSPPYLTKPDIIAAMKADGLKPPRMYEEGFAHNNCGGRCCKAGIGHWAHMLRVRPQAYAQSEREENELRSMLGDVSMLSDRAGGEKKPLTLSALRARIESGDQVDMYEIGGCGCFTDNDSPTDAAASPEPAQAPASDTGSNG